MHAPPSRSQDAVLSLLMRRDTYPVPQPVTHVETHGAHVFLCGDVALKIKRAVRLDYMDLSTPELRHGFLERELALNRSAAPDIYRDIVPITRRPDGVLELAGSGPAVEWVLRMHRFPKDCEMIEVARDGRLTDRVAEALGKSIHAFHTRCPKRAERADVLMGEILDELGRVFAGFVELPRGDLALHLLKDARSRLAGASELLRARTHAGWVRRVHGDLHLGNLLLIDGRPRPFDALEFDERLATTDILYDLAFLLMDLCHRGLGRQANLTMSAYLLAAQGRQDAGLSALPLFMSTRAMIRAMVLLQTAELAADPACGHEAMESEAGRYLEEAERFLQVRDCGLVLIGGLSGSGKTVLARSLAPLIGPCPGAVHLRTDTERRSQPGVTRYDAAARAAVYRRMLDRAKVILEVGRDVVLDATFLDRRQREAAKALSDGLGLRFRGLWLQAPEAVLVRRVLARHSDESEADAAVVAKQVATLDAPPVPGDGWVVLNAEGPPEAVLAAALAALSQDVEA
jgi:aminoglycoside phosphotransferase family enzyme/predicted kinase